MQGKIILNMAMSLDGYIVDENNQYDWIKGCENSDLDTLKSFDYRNFLEEIDVIVMGRISYDEFNQNQEFENKEIVVATKQKRDDFNQTKFVGNNLVEYVTSLRVKGKRIWLFGGSLLTDNFLKLNEIDEYIIGIIPIILGSGKKLFFEKNPRILLKLKRYSFKEGVGILEYSKE